MIRALVLGLLAATAVSSAVAADLIVEEPIYEAAVTAAHDWNGAYVGVFGGYGWGDAEWGTGWDLTVPLDGWLLGGTVGANFQSDSFVFGVEGDLAWSDIGGVTECPNVVFDCTTDINWLGTLRGRVGFAADAALIYATAGVAIAGVENADDNTANVAPPFVSSNTYVGWTAGAGVEFAVSDNMTVKAEYLYVDLGEQTITAADMDVGSDSTVSITAHTAKVGLNFAF